MKAKELRIYNQIHTIMGSYVGFNEIVLDIIYDRGENRCTINGRPEEYFEPIPLTEEWLLKFGFEREGDLNWWNVPKESNYKAHHLMEMQNAWTWFIDFDDTGDNTHLVAGFNYVHQLQNLYFALTGTELVIK